MTDLAVSEESETILRLRLIIAGGTSGDVVLSESVMDFENCGVLHYSWGVPTEETDLAFADNCLKGSQNGFAYEMPIIGNVIEQEKGFLWQPENGKFSLRLDMRV